MDKEEFGLIATEEFIAFEGLPLILLLVQGDEFGFGETYAVNSGTSRVFPDGLKSERNVEKILFFVRRKKNCNHFESRQ